MDIARWGRRSNPSRRRTRRPGIPGGRTETKAGTSPERSGSAERTHAPEETIINEEWEGVQGVEFQLRLGMQEE